MNGKNVLIKDDCVGEKGELGAMLMLGILKTLKECNNKPENIFLLNKGVMLSTQNTDAIEELKELQSIGVKIFSCGTCLDFFSLRNSLQVGEVGNAKDILNALLSDDSITF